MTLSLRDQARDNQLPAKNRFSKDAAGRGRDTPVQTFKATAREKQRILSLAAEYKITPSEWCRYRTLSEGPASADEIARLRASGDL